MNHTKSRIVKMLCAISSAICPVLMFSGCHTVTYEKYDHADKYTAGNFSYQANQIEHVEVNWVAGEIQIKQSTDSTLHAEENGTSLSAEQQLHSYIDGTVLRIQYCASRYRGEIDGAQKHLTLEIPQGISLSVNSVSGNICSDRLLVRNLDFDSVSGEIRIGSLETDYAEIDSVSGDIRLSLLQCKTLKADTTSASVTLILTDDFGAEIDFETVSGDFKSDRLYQIQDKKKILGSGDCKIEVETVSGNLTVQ